MKMSLLDTLGSLLAEIILAADHQPTHMGCSEFLGYRTES
jgi:hypothetical protein